MFHAIHKFCVVDMSNFYLDIIKDRLYTSKPDSVERRAAQTVMYEILESLVLMLTPVLAFTTEEVWQFMPHRAAHDTDSVQLNDWPVLNPQYENKELEEKWQRILDLRADVSKALEIARAGKVIGGSLAASVTVYADEKNFGFIRSLEKEALTIFIISGFELKKLAEAPAEAYSGETVEGLKVVVELATGVKCERCWMYSETVGKHEGHPTICSRCAGVV
jgi:isoleucyl-tRNA synthetase